MSYAICTVFGFGWHGIVRIAMHIPIAMRICIAMHMCSHRGRGKGNVFLCSQDCDFSEDKINKTRQADTIKSTVMVWLNVLNIISGQSWLELGGMSYAICMVLGSRG